MSSDSSSKIDTVLHEERIFEPPSSVVKASTIRGFDQYQAMVDSAKNDPDKFWGDAALKELHWFKPFDSVLDWSNAPFAKWFDGGKTNVSYNCLDRHVNNGKGEKIAIIWEGEPGEIRRISYKELFEEVCRAANALKSIGISKGDLVALYMPMIPEAAIAMLACARIGAPHSVVFGGFSSEALRDRLNDGQVKAVITADGGFRKDKIISLKDAVDSALDGNSCPSVESVLIVKRTSQKVTFINGRDYWWDELISHQAVECLPEQMNSEDRLFVLYTSGSTGKPKGVVHTTSGYNLWAHLTFKWIFDVREEEIYWCTADVGWITGHSYIVYGPLSNGSTTVMYEGVPRPSNPGAFWEVIQRHKINIFYTAPTAIRAFMKSGRSIPEKYDLTSLRLLGTVGEPINPEAWMWYRQVIGGGNCPIVDTWWQTETGGVLISPLPGAIPTKPGSATLPLPGIEADIVTADGQSVEANQGGYLVVKRPWPGMMRTIHGDSQRFRQSYWEYLEPIDNKLVYFAGDGARKDEDGYFWIMGRVDDVINVSGHRLGTMEIESALVSHSYVAEAAVVGRPDEIKGEAVVAFVTLESGKVSDQTLMQDLRNHVSEEIGAIARPDEIRFTDALPKTRSGKIMRRLLRSLAAGEEVIGDTSTLEDRNVLDELRR
ncbi:MULTISPECIES: acetate--CoA ligase [unclassified Prochlorococcus]|uniref:acetate--CoA ligase n=1 Tax=unclassified Prochlorococcus TaxID=2627481 RepID=UPI000533AD15|nr:MULTISPECIES: acetate--CoA ligase [unclassified Prochlorococcus]KGG15364.1 Acetyl-coenzyme A synthetase [Prochlorococcus sp. MIT 0602]KGG17642.1 Acetyl-coenzyme A synthetase [Prochlorococcus sp. MIT 0603]